MSRTRDQPTLMAVFAHPDDEAFGTSGTPSRYAAEGVDVQWNCEIEIDWH